MGQLFERRARAVESTLRELAEIKRYGAEDIGPKIGVTPKTALMYLRFLKIDFPTNGRKVFRLDRTGWDKDVLKWHRAGKSTADIAKLKGCSKSAVYRWLANNGHMTVKERDIHA